ncbi:MAG: hypothetical protein AAGA83_13770 [Cyanobacteria bacterium P01_F01_bin.116]
MGNGLKGQTMGITGAEAYPEGYWAMGISKEMVGWAWPTKSGTA